MSASSDQRGASGVSAPRALAGRVRRGAGVAFVDFAGVFAGLSELPASAGPGFAAGADFRAGVRFSPDRASLIFATGGEAGGGATVDRVSDRPGAEEVAGRAAPSTEAAPDLGEPIGDPAV